MGILKQPLLGIPGERYVPGAFKDSGGHLLVHEANPRISVHNSPQGMRVYVNTHEEAGPHDALTTKLICLDILSKCTSGGNT